MSNKPTGKTISRYVLLVREHRDPRWALDNLVPLRLTHYVVQQLGMEGFKIPS